MNRMKVADITQLRYLFDMYYCVFYNKNIIENPESIFLFLSQWEKNTLVPYLVPLMIETRKSILGFQ